MLPIIYTRLVLVQKFNTNLGWILGFRGNTGISENDLYYGQMIYDISGVETIYSESLVDVFGSKYFLLMLDDYQQNHLNKGLVGITPTQKNVEIPSYWNANQFYNSSSQVLILLLLVLKKNY